MTMKSWCALGFAAFLFAGCGSSPTCFEPLSSACTDCDTFDDRFDGTVTLEGDTTQIVVLECSNGFVIETSRIPGVEGLADLFTTEGTLTGRTVFSEAGTSCGEQVLYFGAPAECASACVLAEACDAPDAEGRCSPFALCPEPTTTASSTL